MNVSAFRVAMRHAQASWLCSGAPDLQARINRLRHLRDEELVQVKLQARLWPRPVCHAAHDPGGIHHTACASTDPGTTTAAHDGGQHLRRRRLFAEEIGQRLGSAEILLQPTLERRSAQRASVQNANGLSCAERLG